MNLNFIELLTISQLITTRLYETALMATISNHKQ